MIVLLLADGFEEIEALTPLDVLRRAGIDVKTVGILADSGFGKAGGGGKIHRANASCVHGGAQAILEGSNKFHINLHTAFGGSNSFESST